MNCRGMDCTRCGCPMVTSIGTLLRTLFHECPRCHLAKSEGVDGDEFGHLWVDHGGEA